MTQRKPWYHHFTADHLIKYFTLAAFITGLLTGIGKVIAVPYVKEQITVSIEDNNKKFLSVIEDKYADKNSTLENIYKLQIENSKRTTELIDRISRIEGKLSR